MGWRKREAQKRDVDEQVVLPGHCVKEIAEPETTDVESVMAVAGFGVCRARYAEEIVTALSVVGNESGEADADASGGGGSVDGSDA